MESPKGGLRKLRLLPALVPAFAMAVLLLLAVSGCATGGPSGPSGREFPESRENPAAPDRLPPPEQGFSGIPPEITITRWSGGAGAACSLTFDDGTLDQYTAAFPLLESRGLKATFFLTTGYRDEGIWMDGTRARRLLTWDQAREIHRAGHELGSHGLYHRDMGLPREEAVYPRLFEEEFGEAARRIREETGAPASFFAWPYFRSDSRARQASAGRYIAARDGYASASRLMAFPDSWFISPPDPQAVVSYALLPSQTAEEWMNLAGHIEEIGGWLVLCFHGVDSPGIPRENLGWAPLPEARFTGILDFLKNPSVWTAPFGTVYRYIRQREAARIELLEYTPALLSFRVSLPDTEEFTGSAPVPLTIRIRKPPLWSDSEIEIPGGHRVLYEDRQEILLETVPLWTPVQNPAIVAQSVTLRTRS